MASLDLVVSGLVAWEGVRLGFQVTSHFLLMNVQ